MNEINIFAESERLQRLAELNNTLLRLNASVNWELFRHTIRKGIRKNSKGRGGRPPYDEVLMFKVLILQRLYQLSDDQIEYQINDRLSFQRFLGLTLSSKVPDAKTIWLFREQLVQADLMESLFGLFWNELESRGLITHEGSIVDASFVEVPIRRDRGGEKETITEGDSPSEWTVHTARQKDCDARWTKKNNRSYFGYKNHIKVDAGSKLIVDYTVTTAQVHDSQALEHLVDRTDVVLYADSAYIGQVLPEGVEDQICERGRRNHPLTAEQKEQNRRKSRTRSRVEHVFGQMCMQMHSKACRLIGKRRVSFQIGLSNLIYNMSRAEFLCRKTVKIG